MVADLLPLRFPSVLLLVVKTAWLLSANHVTINIGQQTEVGTRYFQSTDDNGTNTFPKKYQGYDITVGAF